MTALTENQQLRAAIATLRAELTTSEASRAVLLAERDQARAIATRLANSSEHRTRRIYNPTDQTYDNRVCVDDCPKCAVAAWLDGAKP